MAILVLENVTLSRLARKPLIAAEFPFVKAIVEDCNCSSKKASVDTNAIKAQIANMPQPLRDRFKQLAGADQIRVIFRDASGRREVVF